MTRTAAVADRLLVALLGLALIAAGLVATAWQTGRLPNAADQVPSGWAGDLQGQTWWPWALGAVGAVLVLAGLRWLIAHHPRRRVRTVRLTGTGPTGRLTGDLSALASAAATSVQSELGVHGASGRAVTERGRRLIELSITVEPWMTSAQAQDVAERTLAQLGEAAGPETPARIRIGVH